MRVIIAKIFYKLFLPIIPDRFKLPFSYFITIVRNDGEAELKKLHQVINPGNGVAIDIGANEGLYSYKLSKMFKEVYAFEVNKDLTKSLAAYSDKIKVIRKGLSEAKGFATLYTPIVDGQTLDGWASFSRDNCPSADKLIESSVEISTLDSFHIQNVSFIKIDVEGHEVQVLYGATLTIERERPQILVEVKKENEEKIISFFNSLPYRRTRLEDLISIEGEKENYFFFPIVKQ